MLHMLDKKIEELMHGQCISILDTVDEDEEYDEQEEHLSFLVVAEDSPNLIDKEKGKIIVKISNIHSLALQKRSYINTPLSSLMKTTFYCHINVNNKSYLKMNKKMLLGLTYSQIIHPSTFLAQMPFTVVILKIHTLTPDCSLLKEQTINFILGVVFQ